MESVTLPFEFNGSTFRYGKMSFSALPMADVEGINFSVPTRFALLLLAEAHGALLESVARAPLRRKLF